MGGGIVICRSLPKVEYEEFQEFGMWMSYLYRVYRLPAGVTTYKRTPTPHVYPESRPNVSFPLYPLYSPLSYVYCWTPTNKSEMAKGIRVLCTARILSGARGAGRGGAVLLDWPRINMSLKLVLTFGTRWDLDLLLFCIRHALAPSVINCTTDFTLQYTGFH